MKLFAKYNRINITVTIFTFVLGSVAFYFVLNYVLTRQLKETLRSEQFEIIHYVEQHNSLPEIQNTRHQWITIEKATDVLTKPKFNDIVVYNEKEKEAEPVEQLLFSIKVSGENFLITVNKSKAETEDLLQLIILVTIGMIALILLLNFLINRNIITRLWQPFYFSINNVKEYHLNNRQSLHLPKENTDEFNLLNESLNAMTQSIHQDYQALKAFTENASHEMQTPLAVIRSKTEILLQQQNISEEAMKQIMGIEEGIQKLSRLHQSLLLLTKIENTHFKFDEKVEMGTLVSQKIEEKKELFESKHLTVIQDIQFITLPFHQQLAEILINNLLSNTIRYTPENGVVNIELDKEKLIVRNTATENSLDVEKIFQRFYKAQQNQEGTGLGLAIVKEIGRIAGFEVQYLFHNNFHIFTIYFKQ
jgi:signal transduction histidine kinase